MSTYLTLGGKSLAELPQIPTNFTTTFGVGEITITWTNNNTNVTGTTNVPQYWDGTDWNDSTPVASSATTATITGLPSGETNVRVAVLDGTRYYPSRVVSETVIPPPPYPYDGLVSRYAFDNDLTDSYNSYDLTASTPANVNYVTGKIGNAITNQTGSLTISTTASAVASIRDGTNQYSISWWQKRTASVANQGNTINSMMYNSTDYSRLWNTYVNNIYYFKDRSGATPASTWEFDLTTDVWYHFVMLWDGSATKIYVNGSASPSYTKNETDSMPTASNFRVVNAGSNNVGALVFDLVYVYNKAISTADIAQLYNSGAGV